MGHNSNNTWYRVYGKDGNILRKIFQKNLKCNIIISNSNEKGEGEQKFLLI